MKSFRFSLQKLLELRQMELRSLEMRAAKAAETANTWRRRRSAFVEQLAQLGDKFHQQSWMEIQAAAESLRLHADEASQKFSEADAIRRAVRAEQVTKQTEVESLESMREDERLVHKRVMQRREDAELQAQILQRWMNDAKQRQNDAGSLSHG